MSSKIISSGGSITSRYVDIITSKSKNISIGIRSGYAINDTDNIAIGNYTVQSAFKFNNRYC